MQEADQFRNVAVNLNQTIGKLDRVGGSKADAVDTIDRCNTTDQFGQIGYIASWVAPR